MRFTLRIVLLSAGLLVAVVASALTGGYMLSRADAALTHTVDKDLEQLLALTRARDAFRLLEVRERDFLLARTALERALIAEKLESMASELQAQLHRYAGLMPSEDTHTLGQLGDASARWLVLDGKARAAVAGDPHEALTLVAQHRHDPLAWEAEVDALLARSQARVAERARRSHVAYEAARTGLIALACAAALLGTLLGHALVVEARRARSERSRIAGRPPAPNIMIAPAGSADGRGRLVTLEEQVPANTNAAATPQPVRRRG